MKRRANRSGKDRQRPIEWWAVGLSLLAVALLLVLLMVPGSREPQAVIASPGGAGTGAATPDGHLPTAGPSATDVLYACPMMCIPPTPTPGRCPVCGMDLTPIDGHDHRADEGPPRLGLTAEAVHLADIRTAPVMRMPVTAEVRLFGRIDYDSAHITDITAFMPGVIDRVYVKRAGQFVRWGDPLFDIYSSDLLETQQQLVDAMQYVPSFLAFQSNLPHVARDMPVQSRRTQASSERSQAQTDALKKINALRHKLSILGLPKRDIDEFMIKGEATGIATVYAPMYGQVTVQNATEGSFVNTGTSLFTIADPKYVWARLEAYEADYPWIRRSQPVTFTTEAYPGETFQAKVVYIDPVFDPQTRTFGIGAISTEDQGGRLKAGMLIRAVVHARLDAAGHIVSESTPTEQMPLVIPATAPMITGRRAVVYVSVPGERPTFEGREVVLGPRAKDYYVVRDGLEEGEQVVTNGNFKIDSAMQIAAKPSLMMPGGHAHDDPHARHAAAASPLTMDDDTSADGAESASALADGMNAAYMQERRRSRMEMDAAPSHDNAHRGHAMEDAADSMNHDDGYVSRRKPGAYGDTTRRGAAARRNHRRQP